MNQKAFFAIVNPVKDRLFRMALRILVSRDSAEDAVQEVLLKLWERRDKLTDYNNPSAFAMTVTKNYCYDQLKLKQNNNLRIIHSNYTEKNSALEKQIEAQDDVSFLKKLMNDLPEQQRTIIQLRDIEGMEYDEIEEIMQMSNPAIRVALSRGRKKLREGLLKINEYGVARH